MQVELDQDDRTIVAYDPHSEGQGVLKVIEEAEKGSFYLLWVFPDPDTKDAERIVMVWRDENLEKILHRFVDEVIEFELDLAKDEDSTVTLRAVTQE